MYLLTTYSPILPLDKSRAQTQGAIAAGDNQYVYAPKGQGGVIRILLTIRGVIRILLTTRAIITLLLITRGVITMLPPTPRDIISIMLTKERRCCIASGFPFIY